MTHTTLASIMISVIALLSACANTVEPAPPVATDTGGGPSTEGDVDVTNDESVGDKGELPLSDIDEGTGQIISVADCVSECSSSCSDEKAECVQEGNRVNGTTGDPGIESDCEEEKATCVASCSDNDHEEGGCKPVKIDGPAGDSTVKVPGGAEVVHVELTQCTHRQDVLTVRGGSMSLHSTKGAKGKSNSVKYSTWERVHEAVASTANSKKNVAHTPYAEAGNTAAPVRDERLRERRAFVKIDGKEYEWPYPEVLPFNLASKIGNVDPLRPTSFVRDKVTLEGDEKSEKKKSARWVHFNDYDGAGRHLDLITYNRLPFTKSVDNTRSSDPKRVFRKRVVTYKPTNCQFTTTFKFYYLPQQ